MRIWEWIKGLFSDLAEHAYKDGFRDGAGIAIIVILTILTTLYLLRTEFGAVVLALLAVAGCIALGILLWTKDAEPAPNTPGIKQPRPIDPPRKPPRKDGELT